MVWEDESISDHHVFPSPGCKYYNFGDVIGGEGLAAAKLGDQLGECH